MPIRLPRDAFNQTKLGQDPTNQAIVRREFAEPARAASIARGEASPVAGSGPGERKPVSRPALDTQPSCKKKGKVRLVVLVEIIAFGPREIDDDNLSSGAAKPLRDAIARSLGVDDGDKRLKWRYHHIVTEGSAGTLVRIELIR